MSICLYCKAPEQGASVEELVTSVWPTGRSGGRRRVLMIALTDVGRPILNAPSGISTEKKKQRRKVILLFFLDCRSGCWVNVHSRWCWFLQWHQNQCSWKSNPYPEPTALQEPFRPLMPGLLGLLRHSASWAEQLPISQPFRYDGGLPSSGESRLKQSPKVTEKLPVTFSLWWNYATFSNKAGASKLWNQYQWEDGGQPAREAQAYWGDRRSSKSLL